MLTQERLKELLRYDAKTGKFHWAKKVPHCRHHVGDPAGGKGSCGYVIVKIDKTPYPAHRLVWLWRTGKFPKHDMDHRNGIRDDNKWSNLRAATKIQNRQNIARPSNNTSGFTGVCFFERDNKWQAQIMSDGVRRFLGRYVTPEQAHRAYLAAKKRLHKFQPVPRKD